MRRQAINKKRRVRVVWAASVVFIVGAAGLICCVVALAGEYRIWTTAEGQKSNVRLEVVGQADGRVRLKREDDGRVVELPLEGLSDDDRRYLRETAVKEKQPASFQADEEGYSKLIAPFLERHCLRCHGPDVQEGDFRVDEQLPNDFLATAAADKWSEVLNVLNAAEMPPAGEPRPRVEDARRVVEWIERERLRAEQERRDRTVVLRRMNRQEYNNTIRDLIGIDFELVDEFPEDPPAGGFDNNGGALTVSPLHLELYLKAAQKILDRAIVDEARRPEAIRWRFELEDGREGSSRRRVRLGDANPRVLISSGNREPANGMVLMRHADEPWTGVQFFTVPSDGEYVIRVRAAGVTPPDDAVRRIAPQLHERQQQEREGNLADEATRQKSRASFDQWVIPFVRKHFEQDRRYRYGPPRLRVLGHLGGGRKLLGEFDVAAPPSEPRVYEIRAFLAAQESGINLSNQYSIPSHWYMETFKHHDEFPRPELLLDWIEIEGPLFDAWPPSSHRRILIESPHQGGDEAAYARDVLAEFMRRAYRRPLREGELETKVALFNKVRPHRESFEEAIKAPLVAVLASPHFLYLVEPGHARPLSDDELATRLSYFLWSSMPDDELFALAESGKLNDPATLRGQVDRMLADEKSNALVANFTGQWLRLREVGANPPVQSIYVRYDEHLEVSMRGETEAFFEHILRNDCSVLDFLHSDYVTINERLARFYDIPGVQGDHLRAVPVPRGVPRGGLVTQASILSITSNGTRTSPVWRGAWILENLLGDPPPPPPPNAGDIPPGEPGRDKLTVRERLAAHRRQPQCARCHHKIDPLGFALENFAASGEWRDKEAASYMGPPNQNDPDIDASAQLPDGKHFVGVDGLQRELVHRSDDFLRCLAEKLYTYALGRELRYADEADIDRAVEAMKENDYTLRSLIVQIVSSGAFRAK